MPTLCLGRRMRVSDGILPTPTEPRTDPPTRDVDTPTPAWKRWWCAPLGPVELQFRRDTVEPAVWATLLGLEHNGEVVVGVVSAPALGSRWWAGRGPGAYGRGAPT